MEYIYFQHKFHGTQERTASKPWKRGVMQTLKRRPQAGIFCKTRGSDIYDCDWPGTIFQSVSPARNLHRFLFCYCNLQKIRWCLPPVFQFIHNESQYFCYLNFDGWIRKKVISGFISLKVQGQELLPAPAVPGKTILAEWKIWFAIYRMPVVKFTFRAASSRVRRGSWSTFRTCRRRSCPSNRGCW